MARGWLTEQIGTVCMVIEPDAYSSGATAGQLDATDNDSGVPVRDANKILFILQYGDTTADTGANNMTLAIAYSSTGNASDAANSTDTWASSDAVFTTVDSDDDNEIFLLELDLGGKGLTDAEGKVFVVSTAVLGGVTDFAVVGIPYEVSSGSTNENTIVYVGETST